MSVPIDYDAHKAKVKKVKACMKQDKLSVNEACAKLGVLPNAFYKSRQLLQDRKTPGIRVKRRDKPTAVRIPVADWQPGTEKGGLLFALIGAPAEVMAAIKAYQ